MFHGGIYPDTAARGPHGHLVIGGCDVTDLATEFGTPLYIYDEQTLRGRCRAYTQALAEVYPDFEVIYASKALSCRAMCELVGQEGLSLEVSSGGELMAALLAGFPTERVYFHGNYKTLEEIELGMDAGVGHFMLDSFEEIDRVATRAAARGVQQPVMVRVTPGVAARTHKAMTTGHSESKFGFTLQGGLATEAVRRALASPHLRLDGVHMHIGSQIVELGSYVRAVRTLCAALAQWRVELGLECRLLDLGGGLGIRYTSADGPAPTVKRWVRTVAGAVDRELARHSLPRPRLLVEPGRSIAGRAGVTIYRVGLIKNLPSGTTFVTVDGGMSDNMRPALYGARYEPALANKIDAPLIGRVTIAGRHCETGDILVEDTPLAAAEPGDILVLPVTGAYCYGLSNNYNGQPRPAVVAVRDGQARVIVERETWTDVVRMQRPLRDEPREECAAPSDQIAAVV
jgi:diaminopimelate decarboxylase